MINSNILIFLIIKGISKMYATQETQKSEEYREVKRTKNSTVDYEYQQM